MSIAEISELVGLIITGVGFVISTIKWIKELKEKELKKDIEEFMDEAEKTTLNSATKLRYVILKLSEKYGDKFKKMEEKAKSYIEECIDFSKKINYKK